MFNGLCPLGCERRIRQVGGLAYPVKGMTITFTSKGIVAVPCRRQERLVGQFVPRRKTPGAVACLPRGRPRLVVVLGQRHFGHDCRTATKGLRRCLSGLRGAALQRGLGETGAIISARRISSRGEKLRQ